MKTIILALASIVALATAAQAQGYGYNGYRYGGYSHYSGNGDNGYNPNRGFKRYITYPNDDYARQYGYGYPR